jgi:hypothetical protein
MVLEAQIPESDSRQETDRNLNSWAKSRMFGQDLNFSSFAERF